jgi:hypothetical protein
MTAVKTVTVTSGVRRTHGSDDNCLNHRFEKATTSFFAEGTPSQFEVNSLNPNLVAL